MVLSEKRFSIHQVLQRARRLRGFRALVLLAVIILALSPFYSWRSHSGTTLPLESLPALPSPSLISAYQKRNISRALKGLPTPSFRDNLRSDTTYLTSWPSAGWTNDVMTYMNLIYLAFTTQRVPVLPHFTAGHFQGDSMTVGQIFDLPRLSKALGITIVEWHEVKDPRSAVVDTLGCWNIWQTVQQNGAGPRESRAPVDLKLDLSYTEAPFWVRLSPLEVNDNHATFGSLARLGFPQGLAQAQGQTLPAPLSGQKVRPELQLMCVDYLYYTCSSETYEFEKDYTPAWRFVGQHMHWHDSLLKLTSHYLEGIIGRAPNGELPPWIAIHVRHDDFDTYCGGRPREECFAPLPVIARRVQEVKDELLKNRGVAVEHVIMTSDEKDENWWKEVATFGWHWVEHSKTVAEHGVWYPVLIDAVIQSLADGFVGTQGSTMSLIAARRVHDWHQGVTRMVKFGYPGADDH
ncbi:hypothetical protein DL96DRAFT_1530298 [Flagelloscypha sp. PMI_526]|nr:hypothetical protein DL96DRAFT_1530298 [Flagelloscypha sp. PMI_526]